MSNAQTSVEQSDQENLVELNEELEALKNEHAALRETIPRLESELQAARGRLHLLIGDHFLSGKIDHKYNQINHLRLIIADKTKMRVIWRVVPQSVCGRNVLRRTNDWVLDKVTPKRIYVKRIGSSNTEQFNKDGTGVAKWIKDEIDVEAMGIK